MELKPRRGLTEKSKDNVALFLFLESCDKRYVKAKVKFILLDRYRQKLKTGNIIYAYYMYKLILIKFFGLVQFNARKFKPSSSTSGNLSFVKHELKFNKIRSLLSDDNLTICCEVL